MLKPDAVGVQEESLGRRVAGPLGWRAIKAVARHRMPHARKVYANLMRTAGADHHLQESECREALQHMICGPGGASLPQASSHTGAMARVARDRLFNAAAIRLHGSVD